MQDLGGLRVYARAGIVQRPGRGASDGAEYSATAAERAVTFALTVLRRCVDHPRSNLPEVIHWAGAYQATVKELEERW